MKPDDRRNALTVCEANLLWLEELGNRAKATQILANDELQAAIIAAQNYAGTTPTDGTIAYSDPTGQTAIRAGATALRATEVRRCWLGELAEVYDAVTELRTMTAQAHELTVPHQPANLATTIRTLRWLTMIPANRAMTIHHHIGGEALEEYDHAITWAHDRSTALRSGSLTTSSGKRCPSVHGVIEAARKVTENAPPVPVQKPVGACTNCIRYSINADAPAGGLCAPCARFRSENKCLPRALACREQDRKGLKARYTAAMIEEAKAAAKVKPGRSKAS